MAQRFERPRPARNAIHSVVYRHDSEFCGWPFYCGLWKLPDGDLLAGFKRIQNAYGSAAEVSHLKLTVGRGDLYLIRSKDNGRSWDPRTFLHVWRLGTTKEEIAALGPESYAPEGPLDFTDRNVLVMSGTTPAFLKPDSRSWLRASSDGGRTWRRPILLPMCGLGSLTGHGSPCSLSLASRAIGLPAVASG